MVSWFQSHNYFEYSQVILFLDNCAIRKSNQVVALFKKLNFVTLYILDYSAYFENIRCALA